MWDSRGTLRLGSLCWPLLVVSAKERRVTVNVCFHSPEIHQVCLFIILCCSTDFLATQCVAAFSKLGKRSVECLQAQSV